MSESNVIKICQWPNAVFSLEEANDMIPLLKRISNKHEANIQGAINRQNYLFKSGAPEEIIKYYDQVVIDELRAYARKVLKLGVKQFQGGYYGFDSGFGYWSWVVSEPTISHYHDYLDQPHNRRKLGVIKTGGSGETTKS